MTGPVTGHRVARAVAFLGLWFAVLFLGVAVWDPSTGTVDRVQSYTAGLSLMVAGTAVAVAMRWASPATRILLLAMTVFLVVAVSVLPCVLGGPACSWFVDALAAWATAVAVLVALVFLLAMDQGGHL